jgi:hypothetical protein
MSGPAEAMILLLGAVAAEDIVASAAFRLRVVGGMMPAYMCRLELCPSAAQHDDEGLQSAGEQGDSTGKMTPCRRCTKGSSVSVETGRQGGDRANAGT